ncbi:unnamed protein product [Penicillium manginii]
MDIIRVLADAGAIPTERSISIGGGDEALVLGVAAACGIEDIVKKVLQAGFDPDFTNDPFIPGGRLIPNSTALLGAVQYEQIGVAKFLLDHGANPDTLITVDDRVGGKSFICDNSLMFACVAGKFELAKLLLDYGVKLAAEPSEKRERRSLITEAIRGGVAMLEFLRPHGIAPGPGNAESQSELRRAIAQGNLELTEYLLNQGLEANPRELEGKGSELPLWRGLCWRRRHPVPERRKSNSRVHPAAMLLAESI